MPRFVRLMFGVLWGVLCVGVGAQEEVEPPVGPSLELASAGVGGVVRAGDWAGFQIEITDDADTQREVLLEVRGWDADGDTPLYQRAIATNPGITQRAWVYAKLPARLSRGETVRISAYSAVDGDGPTGFVADGLLARREVLLEAVLDPGVGALLVVGRTPGGLRLYSDRGTGGQGPSRSTGHEATEIWGGLEPEDLPDRWVGLRPYEVIVWTDARVSRLTRERAGALLEWVQRGGHLVLGPRAGAVEWLDREANPLGEALPDVVSEEIDASLAGALISGLVEDPPRGLWLQGFSGDGRDGTIPVLEARDGSALVVRRVYGLGMVTLVGIDLGNSTLADRALPRAEAFWHRVLGWRGRPMAEDEGTTGGGGLFAAREAAFLDDDIRSQIAKSGPAAAGVLLGLITFLVYLLVAGPGGFLLLKKLGRVKHAWTGYVLSALVFTLIAWGGAEALRSKDVEVRHLTFLDAVSGEGIISTRTWASVLLPSYGEATLSVEDGRGGGAIGPWESPDYGGAALWGESFPDVRPYAVDGRGVASITVPMRSTVKQVRLDWAGAPTQGWGVIRSVSEDGLGESELTVDTGGRVTGVLSHSLPAALEDVVILVNSGQTPLAQSAGDRYFAQAEVYELTGAYDEWKPGQTLDLAEVTGAVSRAEASAADFFADLSRDRGLLPTLGEEGAELRNAPDRLTAASWVTQFEPPDGEGSRGTGTIAALRRETWGLDLGRWFTQPCVIVIGHVLGEEPLAAPLRVSLGGRAQAVRTSGRTVVRWVYPLAPSPPRWTGVALIEQERRESAGEKPEGE